MWEDLGRFASQAAISFFGAGVDQNFDKEFAAYPVSFSGKDGLEKGNKILLPQSSLGILARMRVTWPMLFRISNRNTNRQSHGGVLEFTAEEGTCYIPYWMMQHLLLREGDLVRVENVTLPKGSYVKLQPVSRSFLNISNPKAVLETSLRHFAALSVGDSIPITYNEKTYEIEILELKPESAVSVIETDMEVDFHVPKGWTEAPASSKTTHSGSHELAKTPSGSSSVFNGSGQRLDGGREAGNTTAEPWKSGIPNGVRSHCPGWEQLIAEGRIPGVIGSHRGKDANLFGGKGQQIGTLKPSQ